MDVTNLTLILFTLFSSLRIVSYVPQIHRVALDDNGASAISYSTWSLWTCANVATAFYAAVNLRDLYLSAVSGIYAFCCVVVIMLTMLKRRRLRTRPAFTAAGEVDSERVAAIESMKDVVDAAASSLLKGERPHHVFEGDLAALARRIFWRDVVAAIKPGRSIPDTPAWTSQIRSRAA